MRAEDFPGSEIIQINTKEIRTLCPGLPGETLQGGFISCVLSCGLSLGQEQHQCQQGNPETPEKCVEKISDADNLIKDE